MSETKGWTERRRKQQACNARRNKPWQSSTGPKTAKGKKASSKNALKHGEYALGYDLLRAAFRMNRAFVRHVMAYDAATRELDRILAKKRSERISSQIKGDSFP